MQVTASAWSFRSTSIIPSYITALKKSIKVKKIIYRDVDKRERCVKFSVYPRNGFRKKIIYHWPPEVFSIPLSSADFIKRAKNNTCICNCLKPRMWSAPTSVHAVVPGQGVGKLPIVDWVLWPLDWRGRSTHSTAGLVGLLQYGGGNYLSSITSLQSSVCGDRKIYQSGYKILILT